MAKIGGLVALVSIAFLPIAGCGSVGVSGWDIIRANDVGILLKGLILFSALCALFAALTTAVTGLFVTGGGGILSLLIGYTLARQNIPVDLKVGAYLAFIGFGLVLVDAVLRQQKESASKPPAG